MFSSISKIPLNYLLCITYSLVLVCFAVNYFKPQALFGAGNVGQIVVGLCQIALGLIVLMLAFVALRKLLT